MTEEESVTLVNMAEAGSAIIADHTTINLANVPQEAITQAKESLHIAYGHTSHGSQVTTGMTGLVSFAGAPYGGDLYQWNNGGTNGALDLRDSPFSGASDLGNPDRTAWATATRNYLNTHPDVNVVMWSWCGQVDGTEAEIDTYLDLMSDLEADYPNVKFIYMTGHLNGGGESGNVNLRNEQIRDYCRENNKILFDFADIESYDPDAETNYMVLFADDACNYKLNGQTRNWATEWQDSHPENVAGEPSWYQCSAAHTQPLNANMKAYAAWWLFARLAGWDGSSGTTTGSLTVTSTPVGAAITLDGTETGQVTLYTFNNLNPGEHIIALNLAGYEPASKAVSVIAGSSVPAEFILVEIPSPTTGSIAVNSTPQGATITLDGTETGQVTPYTFDNLNPGDHTVAVNLAGYEPASQTITVIAGSTVPADFTLVEIPSPTTGSIAVNSTPQGAAITLDGTETGQVTPYTFDNLNPGDHTVAVNLAGYEPASQTVAVVAGSTVPADFTLVEIPSPTTGSIAVNSTPQGAAITLDGTETGQVTPYTFDNLNPGDHIVALNLAGYEPASQTITVVAGSTVPADFTLVEIPSPTTGSIAVNSTPQGAAITLDGTETGQVTPYTFDNLNPGDHTVALNLAGYEPATQTVAVVAGSTVNADFTLVEIPSPTTGSIAVNSTPAGAAITLDGTETGQVTPYTFDNLNPGEHTVALNLAGYEPASQTVAVVAGSTVPADFTLVEIPSPTTGSIAVNSTPQGAAFTLDGTETGQVTPYTFDNLNPGDHTVAVNLAGYEPASQTITVIAGSTVPADFTLVEIPSPTTGSIAVNSTPQGAAITLDGTETGQVTPYTFDNLNPGDHTVAVNLAGYEPASQTVAVIAGSTVPADFTLVEIPSPTTGSIAVNSTPQGAAIILDGTDTGQVTPYTFDNLNPGDHIVALNLAGYEPASQTVAVVAGSTVPADFTLVEIPSPTTGSIAVNSTPQGAAITLDGTETGQVTPYTFDNLNPGEHTVAVNLAGYEPASQTVAVVAGSTVPADFTLVEISSPTTGSIAVNSTPQGAAITLDGTETGQVTPYTFDNLNPGDHTVAVNLAGYEPASQTITVVAGSTVPADFTLVEIPSPTTGSIAVNSTPQGAAITLDGTETGQVTPYTFDNLNPGDHTVVVNLAGYEPTSKTVSVVAGSTATADFTLVQIPGNAPVVKQVSPNNGETGKLVRNLQITGKNFQKGAMVKFQKEGQQDIIPTWTMVRDDKKITCMVLIPQDAEPGPWDVTVTNPDGNSGTKPDAFMIKETPAPVVKAVAPANAQAGRMIWNLQVAGENFQQGAIVKFQKEGEKDIIPLFSIVMNDKRIFCVLYIPESAEAGSWDVTVTNPGGLSGTKAGAFTVKSDKKAGRTPHTESTPTKGSPAVART